MKHSCRRGGQAIGALEGPAWAAPGEIVKLADSDDWGRVETLWRCCHTYDVRVAAFGDQEAGTLVLGPEGLENAWDAYPANMPPKGYPVPKHARRGVRVGGLPKGE
jgi:hypothetical protein